MVERSPGASLGKVLVSEGVPFWYDAARNGLYRIDPVLADVLEIFTEDNDDEVLARLGRRHARRALEAAIQEIRQARRDEGMFVQVGPPLSAPDPARPRDGKSAAVGHLTLSLTEACNLRCRYCSQAIGPAGRGDRVMSEDTALRAVAWFAGQGDQAADRIISFYGGEPLLRFDLIEKVVGRTRKNPDWPAITFIIDTNGTLIDERIVRFVADERIHLQVSLDGPAPIHDRHRQERGGSATHAGIIAGLRRLLVADPSAAGRIRFIVTLTPPYEILEISRYFQDFPLYRDLGIEAKPQVQLNFASVEGTVLADEMDAATRGDQWRSAMDAARRDYAQALRDGRRSELSPPLARLFDDPLIRWHHRPRTALGATYFPAGACDPGTRRVHVGPDGRFLPCERAGAEVAIGDIDRGLDGQAVADLQQALLDVLDGRCRTCWALRLCRICFTSVRPNLPREAARTRMEGLCRGVRRETAAQLALYLDLMHNGKESLEFLKRTTVV